MWICESKIPKRELKNEIKNEIKDELNQELKNELKREIKNVSKDEAKIEVLTDQRIISVKTITKVMKAIGKITIKLKNEKTNYATWFFMNYSKLLKCLMTN